MAALACNLSCGHRSLLVEHNTDLFAVALRKVDMPQDCTPDKWVSCKLLEDYHTLADCNSIVLVVGDIARDYSVPGLRVVRRPDIDAGTQSEEWSAKACARCSASSSLAAIHGSYHTRTLCLLLLQLEQARDHLETADHLEIWRPRKNHSSASGAAALDMLDEIDGLNIARGGFVVCRWGGHMSSGRLNSWTWSPPGDLLTRHRLLNYGHWVASDNLRTVGDSHFAQIKSRSHALPQCRLLIESLFAHLVKTTHALSKV